MPISMPSGTPVDLNIAYQNGNEINQKPFVPVVIKQPAQMGLLQGYDISTMMANASIVLSGISDVGKPAMTVLGPGTLMVKGSGTINTDAGYAILQAGNGDFGGHLVSLAASGALILSSNGSINLVQSGGTGQLVIANMGDGQGLGGELIISAFAGSGQLTYILGPNEGWYSRDSSSNLQLVPNSGQVVDIIKMVLRRYGLI